MLKFLVTLLVVMELALPAAEAKTSKKHIAAGFIGIVTAPIGLPISLLSRRIFSSHFAAKGNYRAAAIVSDSMVYDVYWVEDWW